MLAPCHNRVNDLFPYGFDAKVPLMSTAFILGMGHGTFVDRARCPMLLDARTSFIWFGVYIAGAVVRGSVNSLEADAGGPGPFRGSGAGSHRVVALANIRGPLFRQGRWPSQSFVDDELCGLCLAVAPCHGAVKFLSRCPTRGVFHIFLSSIPVSSGLLPPFAENPPQGPKRRPMQNRSLWPAR